MRWLLDQGLPRRSAILLREAGFDVIHAGEAGMAEATDEAILRMADEGGRVVVTLDADFHALLAIQGRSGPSVVRIREEGLRGPEVARLIQLIDERFGPDLEAGCVLTYRAGTVRSRKLPLI